MTTAIDPIVARAVQSPPRGLKDLLRDWIPRLVLAPSFALVLIFVYGFNLWTLLISFTNSKAFTNFNFIGWANYAKLQRELAYLEARHDEQAGRERKERERRIHRVSRKEQKKQRRG